MLVKLLLLSAFASFPTTLAYFPAPESEIPRVGQEGVEKPVVTRMVYPKYPEAARGLGIQGWVTLQGIFRADGRIDELEVIRTLGRGRYGFEEAAIRAVKRWRFKPGQVDGKPSDVIVTLRINFRLKDDDT